MDQNVKGRWFSRYEILDLFHKSLFQFFIPLEVSTVEEVRGEVSGSLAAGQEKYQTINDLFTYIYLHPLLSFSLMLIEVSGVDK